MPVYVSYAHLLRKGVRNNSLVLFTRMCNSWMTIKNRCKLWKLIIAILGYQWMPWLIMEVDSWNRTMKIKSWKHHGVCITIIKVKIHTNTNKEKFGCRVSTVVLGKWLPREHTSVRHICCRSTMVLGKWLPREQIGVRHMVWKKDVGKIGHVEDRTLFDVTEGRNFN